MQKNTFKQESTFTSSNCRSRLDNRVNILTDVQIKSGAIKMSRKQSHKRRERAAGRTECKMKKRKRGRECWLTTTIPLSAVYMEPHHRHGTAYCVCVCSVTETPHVKVCGIIFSVFQEETRDFQMQAEFKRNRLQI